jgi:peptidyl-prolyl cis-trans isomerase B (cyclophilin B)
MILGRGQHFDSAPTLNYALPAESGSTNIVEESTVQMIESLESRTLMHTAVQSMRADNRGECTITLTEPAKTSTVNSTSVMMFRGGSDGLLGTTDDVKVNASVKYTNATRRIVVRAKTDLPANTAYMIKIFGNRLLSADGHKFDGEFNGTFPSGNGIDGGDFRVQTKKDRTDRPQVRFSTSEGAIDIELFRGSGPTRTTPKHVAYFQKIMNAGSYDSNLVHRLAEDFVVQWGGLTVNATGNVGQVPDAPGVQSEPGNSNIIGTIAYALGNHVADNEFFFNIANNNGTGLTPNLDDASNGGPFTVFGRVIAGLSVLTNINANFKRLNLNGSLGSLGSSVDNVPVDPSVNVTGETPGTGGTTSDTLTVADFVTVRRVAERMKLARIV